MSRVRLAQVSKHYAGRPAVIDVNLDIRDGEFVTLLGPSGCGKTTTLRMIAGFVIPDSGSVWIGDMDVSTLPTYRRNTGMVFQNYALFPHLTVAQNIEYGLKIRRLPSAERRRRVQEALDLVQLGHVADRFPKQLSGGQQQRVALARAIVIEPDILLLDEPLGALDLKLRHELQVEISRIQKTLGITTVYVTHDQEEALSLSDRIAVMHAGRVLQVGPPTSLYERPASAYVAKFLGRSNLIEVVVSSYSSATRTVIAQACEEPDRRFHVAADEGAPVFDIGAKCLLGFRPERASFDADLPNRLPAKVESATYYGSTWSVALRSAVAGQVDVESVPGRAPPNVGDHIEVRWAAADCFLLPGGAS